MSITCEEYKRMLEKKTDTKYHAEKKEVDGIKFPSKLEARYYQTLKLRQKTGDIKYFLRQVPLRLQAGIVFWCDFMVVELDNSIRWIDSKGFETKEFKIKRKLTEDLYPIKIEVIK